MPQPINAASEAIAEYAERRRNNRRSPMNNEPFGRQPKPVAVLLYGEAADVEYWKRELARRAEFKDDLVQQSQFGHGFVIYPRAVND